MSIKEFFDAIGKAWNTLIGGIKSVLHKLFTAKYGVWVVLGLIICFFIGKTIIDYQEFDQNCENFKSAMQYERERIINKYNIEEGSKTCTSDECQDEVWIIFQIEQNFRNEENFFLGQRCLSNDDYEFKLN